MDPFVFIDEQNISDEICNTIISIDDNAGYIPLYPEESSSWFSIINHLIPNISTAITNFIRHHSLDVYNMKNIIQNSDFLQANMQIYKSATDKYHNDFKMIENKHSTLSYLWCLSPSADIIFGKSYKVSIKKGDLVLFPASWEYPYKLDPIGIYLKGTLYTSYE